MFDATHTAPVLRPTYVSKTSELKSKYSLKEKAKMNENKPAKGVKTKIRGRKLRSGVNWQRGVKRENSLNKRTQTKGWVTRRHKTSEFKN